MQHAAPTHDIESMPRTLHVLGCSSRNDNADLSGEYHLLGTENGQPLFQKSCNCVFIRFAAFHNRWVVTRGQHDVEDPFAYADRLASCNWEDLIWYVFEQRSQRFIADPGMFVTAAPSSVLIFGRGVGRENDAINGRYFLKGLHEKRVFYAQKDVPNVIRYRATGNRWTISLHGLHDSNNDECTAWADAHEFLHPGSPKLVWQVFEGARGEFLEDEQLVAFDGPDTVEVVTSLEAPTLLQGIQRDALAASGTYTFVGFHEGRPAYANVESDHLIRYHPLSNKWLLDFGCFRTSGECVAFAEANACIHPGCASLIWHVWNPQREAYVVDKTWRILTAPPAIEVSGLVNVDSRFQKGCINGTYDLVGLHMGKPAYAKAGTTHVIRYWPSWDRWLLDTEGFQESIQCAAFANCCCTNHPGVSALVWNVWDESLGQHVIDQNMVVSETTRKLKQPLLMPSDLRNATDEQPRAKVARLDRHSHELPRHLRPLAKENQGGGFWNGVKESLGNRVDGVKTSLGNGVKAGLRNLWPGGNSQQDGIFRPPQSTGLNIKRRYEQL